MSRISFQSPEQLKDTTKFLDAWIPETRILIEHKARGVSDAEIPPLDDEIRELLIKSSKETQTTDARKRRSNSQMLREPCLTNLPLAPTKWEKPFRDPYGA